MSCVLLEILGITPVWGEELERDEGLALQQQAWVWPPIGKEPETSPADSVLRITPVCKEPPAAREQGPRDQCKNPGR